MAFRKTKTIIYDCPLHKGLVDFGKHCACCDFYLGFSHDGDLECAYDKEIMKQYEDK